jgi:hypothetical protein
MRLRTRNFLYTRVEPTKDAKLIVIYCEGKKREKDYFNYFAEISSKIRLEVEEPSQHDDNSPYGLYKKVVSHVVKSENNPNPKYNSDDEIWIVFDTDEWGEQIVTVREKSKNNGWNIAQSNPCFEVWLFYHLFEFQEFEGMEISENWKNFVNSKIKGGFDSRKHPIFIKTAIKNAKAKFDESMTIGSTEVYKLAESFYPYISDEIEDALRKYVTKPSTE